MLVQAPEVAGRFYPAEADVLGEVVHNLLSDRAGRVVPSPKALILPHAGYRFSGAAAAAGVSRLDPDAGISRVVILGPAHHCRFDGIALPGVEGLQTPLGILPMDAAASALLELDDVNTIPEAYAEEHAIEVELPLLQGRIGTFDVLPLLVGNITTERLAEILGAVWGGSETLVVVSTDLTHFLDAAEGRKTDLATAKKIELAEPDGLTTFEACGARALAALLSLAAEKGLRLTRLALTHSGAVTGDLSRVVGYGAWMAHWPGQQTLADELRSEALDLVRQALESRVRRGRAPTVDLSSFAMPLQSTAASFVTLTQDNHLRGCIGSLTAHRPLIEDLVANTAKAGCEDPRFKPISLEEIGRLDVEIAVLTRPAPLQFSDEDDLLEQLRPGEDGLILEAAGRRSTFLPKVWDSVGDARTFWRLLKRKAGLAETHWSDDMKVSRYATESFGTRRG